MLDSPDRTGVSIYGLPFGKLQINGGERAQAMKGDC